MGLGVTMEFFFLYSLVFCHETSFNTFRCWGIVAKAGAVKRTASWNASAEKLSFLNEICLHQNCFSHLFA